MSESLLNQPRHVLELILNNALDAFVVINRNSEVQAWTRRAEELFGWSQEEALGQLISGLIIPPGLRDAHHQGMQRYLACGEHAVLNQRIEITAQHKDGRIFPVELSITPIEIDGDVIFSAAIRDITERRAAADALQAQTVLMDSILESVPDPISVADQSGRMLKINAAAERLLGLDPIQENPHQTYHRYELYSPEDPTRLIPESERPMPRAIGGEAVTNQELVVRHAKSPEGRTMLANARPLKDREGRPMGGVVVFRDVTDLRSAEQALLREKKHTEAILESISDAFYALDKDWRFSYLNQQATQVLGRPAESLLGKVFWEEFPDCVGSRACLKFHDARARGGLQVFEERHPESGIWYEVRIYPHSDGMSVSLHDITQRKRYEEALTESEEQFRATFDQAAVGIGHMKPDRTILRLNQKLCDILGYTREELIRMPNTEALSHPDDLELTRENVVRVLAGEAPGCTFEKRYRHKRGYYIWARVTLSLLRNQDGSPKYFIVVIDDITETRRLQEHAERLAAVIDATPDFVGFADLQGRHIYLNAAARRVTGIPPDAPLDDFPITAKYPPHVQEIIKHGIEVAMAQGAWRGETAVLDAAGREIPASQVIIAHRDRNGAVRNLSTIIRDMTDRYRMEQALRESEERFRLIVESSADYAIMMLDPSGCITSWNTGAESVFGYTAEEALGRSFTFIYPPEDNARQEAERELNIAYTEGRADDERWHLRKDGNRFWATGIIAPVRDGQGGARGFVKIARDTTERKLHEEQTYYLANHDALTGLPNRANFSTRLHEEMSRTRREHPYLALLMLDLDNFKQVNDTLGHDVGDLLLQEVGHRLLSCARETDVVARLGGDEFVIIQTGINHPGAAIPLARKLVETLGRPYQLMGHEVTSGTSIGIAVYPEDAGSSIDLLKHADMALYKAKEQGRGTYRLFTPHLQAEAETLAALEKALRHAVEHREFSVYYQPVIDLASWSVTTVEALIRWQSPDLDSRDLGELLKIAEETALIVSLGEHMLRQACRHVKAWHDQGLPAFGLSVNVSPRQLRDPGFEVMVKSVLLETGLPPSCLTLEITEGVLLEHTEANQALLLALRKAGIQIAIDDFGTGFSALSYLRHFPVNSLKIDQSFIRRIPYSHHDSAIVTSVINLACDLGIDIVAEGVETSDQLSFLQAKGCKGAQGFLFSEPVNAAEMARLLHLGRWLRTNPATTPG